MRRLDWPERLADEISAAEKKRYSEDYFCATFAADVVRAMTGDDPMAPYRNMTRADAEAKMLQDHGSLTECLEALFGAAVLPAFAQRGDVIVRRDDNANIALGICLGIESAFTSSDGGLAFYKTLDCDEAYRV